MELPKLSGILPFKRLVKRHIIIVDAVAFVALLVVAKYFIDSAGFAVIPLNALVTAFFGGVFFTMGILFAGAVSDYKEAEKIPGEIAVSLKTLRADISVIPGKENEKKILSALDSGVKDLLYAINSNFRKNDWKLGALDAVHAGINKKIAELAELGTAPGFITKLRSELTTIDRLSHRVDTISETSFIPAAYAIAETAIAITIILLLFLKLDSVYLGMLLTGAVSLVLFSLLILIKDMDNPFEVGKDSYADVDLHVLFRLEEIWKGEGL